MKSGTFEKNYFMDKFEEYFHYYSTALNGILFIKDGKFLIWDPNSETAKNLFEDQQKDAGFIGFSVGCSCAIIKYWNSDNILLYWNMETNEKIGELKGHSQSVADLNISLDGSIAVSCSYDKTIIVWDLKKCEQELKIEGLNKAPTLIKLFNNKKFCLSNEGDLNLVIWDLNAKTRYANFRILHGINIKLSGINVIDGDKYAVTADEYNGIRIWNIAEKRKELEFGFIDDAIKWFKEKNLNIYLSRRWLKA